MGGGASKDKYVMKKALGPPLVVASLSDLEHTEGLPERRKSTLKKQKSKIDQDPTVTSLSEAPLDRQKSGIKRSPSVGNIDRAQSFASLGKGQSSSNLGPITRATSSSVLIPGRSISRSNSIMSRSNSISPNGGLQISPKVPWLVKQMPTRSASSIENFEFVNEKVLGVGLMGTVRLAKVVNNASPAYVAIKSIRKDYIAKHNDERHVNHERNILMLMNSPFCIKMFGTFQDPERIYFTMEFAAGGELFRRITRRNAFSPNAAKFYLCEVFLAILHVQNLGFVYRDLKPENVMLDEHGHCKLIDFGFCTVPDANGMCKTNVGTPAYLSPEQLNMKFTNGYTRIVDWWSMGVLLYELLTSSTPFCKKSSESHYEIYLRVLKGKISYPRGFDSSAKDLISKLLNPEISARLVDPAQIQKHAFFSDVDWDSIARLQIVPPFVPKLSNPGDMQHFDDFGAFHDRPTKPKKGTKSVPTGGLNHMEGF